MNQTAVYDYLIEVTLLRSRFQSEMEKVINMQKKLKYVLWNMMNVCTETSSLSPLKLLF